MKSRLIKLISSVVIVLFIFTTVSWAGPNGAYTVRIPEEYGKVKERYQGKTDEVVVHIQDAHTSFEAQKNLCSLIEYFVNEKGVNIVAAEGAEGNAGLNTLRQIPELNVKRPVVEDFLREGRLKGAEAAHVISPKYFELFGAEDMNLYDINFEAFVNTLSKREEILDQIEQVENILNDLKAPLYSERVARFDTAVADYRDGKVDFFNHCGTLLSYAGKAGIDISTYVNFTMLLEAKSWEDQIDFNKIDEERDKVITLLKFNLSHADDPLMQKKAEVFERELRIFEQRDDKKSASNIQFYTLLKNLANEHQFDYEEIKNFNNFATYLSFFSRLDKAGLLYECKKLQREIEDRLAEEENERELIKLSRHIRLLKDIVELKVLPEDVTYYRNNKDKFSSSVFTEYISKNAPDKSLDSHVVLLDEILPSVDDFYKFAEERSEVITKNALNKLQNSNGKIMPLIAGGYHTDGITRVLKEKGISYLVITPQIEKAVEDVPYLDSMLNVKTPFELMIEAAYNTIVDAFAVEDQKKYEARLAQWAQAQGKTVAEVLAQVPRPPLPPSPLDIMSLEFNLDMQNRIIARILPAVKEGKLQAAEYQVRLQQGLAPVLVNSLQEYLENIGIKPGVGGVGIAIYEGPEVETLLEAKYPGVFRIERTAVRPDITAPGGETDIPALIDTYRLWYRDTQKTPIVLKNPEDVQTIVDAIASERIKPLPFDVTEAQQAIIHETIDNMFPDIKVREELMEEPYYLLKMAFSSIEEGLAFSPTGREIPATARTIIENIIDEYDVTALDVTRMAQEVSEVPMPPKALDALPVSLREVFEREITRGVAYVPEEFNETALVIAQALELTQVMSNIWDQGISFPLREAFNSLISYLTISTEEPKLNYEFLKVEAERVRPLVDYFTTNLAFLLTQQKSITPAQTARMIADISSKRQYVIPVTQLDQVPPIPESVLPGTVDEALRDEGYEPIAFRGIAQQIQQGLYLPSHIRTAVETIKGEESALIDQISESVSELSIPIAELPPLAPIINVVQEMIQSVIQETIQPLYEVNELIAKARSLQALIEDQLVQLPEYSDGARALAQLSELIKVDETIDLTQAPQEAEKVAKIVEYFETVAQSPEVISEKAVLDSLPFIARQQVNNIVQADEKERLVQIAKLQKANVSIEKLAPREKEVQKQVTDNTIAKIAKSLNIASSIKTQRQQLADRFDREELPRDAALIEALDKLGELFTFSVDTTLPDAGLRRQVSDEINRIVGIVNFFDSLSGRYFAREDGKEFKLKFLSPEAARKLHAQEAVKDHEGKDFFPKQVYSYVDERTQTAYSFLPYVVGALKAESERIIEQRTNPDKISLPGAKTIQEVSLHEQYLLEKGPRELEADRRAEEVQAHEEAGVSAETYAVANATINSFNPETAEVETPRLLTTFDIIEELVEDELVTIAGRTAQEIPQEMLPAQETLPPAKRDLVILIRAQDLLNENQKGYVRELQRTLDRYSRSVLDNIYVSVEGLIDLSEAQLRNIREIVESIDEKAKRAHVIDRGDMALLQTADRIKYIVGNETSLNEVVPQIEGPKVVVVTDTPEDMPSELRLDIPILPASFVASFATKLSLFDAEELKTQKNVGFLTMRAVPIQNVLTFQMNPDILNQLDLSDILEHLKDVLEGMNDQLRQHRREALTIHIAA